MDVDQFLAVEDSFRVSLRAEILAAVVHHERHRPRSLQTRLGPSEVGSPCARRLAFGSAGTKEKGSNKYTEVMPSMIGTAMHAQMEKVMELQNQILGRERWHSEIKVLEPVAGTCDLYDEDTNTVVDWKFLGKSTWSKYSTKGPNDEYRKQVHLYGLGIENMGMKVENVSIMMFNRNGRLRDAHLWMEPFDRQLALDTASRYADIEAAAKGFEMLENPYRFNYIPATPGDCCFFCPFFDGMSDGTNPWACTGTVKDPNILHNQWLEEQQQLTLPPAEETE
jgi:hypothetical protein